MATEDTWDQAGAALTPGVIEKHPLLSQQGDPHADADADPLHKALPEPAEIPAQLKLHFLLTKPCMLYNKRWLSRERTFRT